MSLSEMPKRTLEIYNPFDLDRIPQVKRLPDAMRTAPIFQLTFPQEGMLATEDFQRMSDLITYGTSNTELAAAAREIQLKLNPHPAGQLELNVPQMEGHRIPGLQHKDR